MLISLVEMKQNLKFNEKCLSEMEIREKLLQLLEV